MTVIIIIFWICYFHSYCGVIVHTVLHFSTNFDEICYCPSVISRNAFRISA